MLDYSAVQFILESLGHIFGIIAALSVLVIFNKAGEYFTSRTSRTQQKLIAHFIDAFVKSADQLYHDADENGSIRMEYVRDHLEAIGININNEIESLVEAAVWNVNQSAKSKGENQNAGRKKSP